MNDTVQRALMIALLALNLFAAFLNLRMLDKIFDHMGIVAPSPEIKEKTDPDEQRRDIYKKW